MITEENETTANNEFGVYDEAIRLNVRHSADTKYPFLRWTVGLVQSEFRSHDETRNQDRFSGMVQIFRLLGWSSEREEAVAMALKKLNRNNS